MTNQELRDKLKKLLDEVCSEEYVVQLIDEIDSEVRQAQLTILDQVRMQQDTGETTMFEDMRNACIREFNQRIDALKAELESK